MTRRQCQERMKIDTEFKQLYHRTRRVARKHFRCLIEIMQLIRPGVRVILHHKNPACNNYEEWRVEELIPVFNDEHQILHQLGTSKYGVLRNDPLYASVRRNIIGDYLRQQGREYYNSNKSKHKVYKAINKEKTKIYNRTYREKHRERLLERDRQYRASHKEDRKIYDAKRNKTNRIEGLA